MENIKEALDLTDWKEFADQKQHLLDIITLPTVEVYGDKLQGLIDFIDALQDAMIEDGLYSKNEIFPKLNKKTKNE